MSSKNGRTKRTLTEKDWGWQMEKCHKANLMLPNLQSHIFHLWHFFPGAGCLSMGLVQVFSSWGDVEVKKQRHHSSLLISERGKQKNEESATVQSWLITRHLSDSESQRTVNLIAIYMQSKYKFPKNHQFNEASISDWILKSCRLKTCTTIQPLLTPHYCSGPQSFLLGKSHGRAVALALQ